jgi:hypothetical protein
MQNRPFPCLAWLIVCLLAVGCAEKSTPTSGSAIDSMAVDPPAAFCGEAELLNVNGQSGSSIGVLELQNDPEFLWITVTPPSGMKLSSLSLFVGDQHQCPRKATGANDYAQFPIQAPEVADGGVWSARIPLEQLAPCVFTALQFTVQSPDGPLSGELLSGRGDHIIPGIEYCIRRCDFQKSACGLGDAGKLPRTVPQEAWTRDPKLGNQLREAFATRYPQGLTLGCNNQLTFTSPEDILGSLPMKGKALPLAATEAAVKPGMLDNQLAGELLTLDLAIQLDAHYADFSEGQVPLYALQVTKGAFEGWTLAELQQEGNSVLGACTSNFTPEQIAEVLHGINANFVLGKPAGDQLRCKTD